MIFSSLPFLIFLAVLLAVVAVLRGELKRRTTIF